MQASIVEIVSNRPIAQGIYEMILRYPQGWDTPPQPGQFVQIRVPDGAAFLRRPISINNAHENTITLAYQVKGKGTLALASCIAGDTLDVFGFLGKGYRLLEDAKKILLVGGGIGIAPLLYCAQYWKDVQFDAILGYRCSDVAYEIDEFDMVCENVYIACDDGSIGEKGFVSQLLERNIDSIQPDVIMVCGPMPMLKAVAKITKEHHIPCQVSLEERMGCGMGACMVCNCAINTEDGWEYQRVCADGPVFDAEEVAGL